MRGGGGSRAGRHRRLEVDAAALDLPVTEGGGFLPFRSALFGFPFDGKCLKDFMGGAHVPGITLKR